MDVEQKPISAVMTVGNHKEITKIADKFLDGLKGLTSHFPEEPAASFTSRMEQHGAITTVLPTLNHSLVETDRAIRLGAFELLPAYGCLLQAGDDLANIKGERQELVNKITRAESNVEKALDANEREATPTNNKRLRECINEERRSRVKLRYHDMQLDNRRLKREQAEHYSVHVRGGVLESIDAANQETVSRRPVVNHESPAQS
jgi:hypothetical protein